MPAAYVIVDIDVHDPATYEEYKRLAPAAVAAFGGEYLVRGGEAEVLEGAWQPRRLVVLRFPDREQARAWLHSPAYAPARAIRLRSAATNMVAADGVD